ncbi:MAG TPA: Ig-like domain-containing protein, partial [Gemmatimonadales bacterium]|nr:Ig-like domain-containing protein [Gemmatimonadales bacterium]
MLPRPRRGAPLALVALALVGACGTEPRVPSSITLTPPSISFTALGQTQQLASSVSDQHGDPLTDAAISWSTDNGAVAAVSSTGLVTAQGPGTAQIVAAAGSANATVSVSVVQAPSQLTKVSGDGQTATAGAPLGAPLVVEVEDALGSPVAGVSVTFDPEGGGQVSPASSMTDAAGRAATILTTGLVAGIPQAVTVSIPGLAISVSFSATTTAGPAASISIAAGNNQKAVVGQAVPVRPAVVVRDANGNPVPGVAIEFEVVSGGGSISGGSAVTDAGGRAEVGSWTLGSDGPNQLRATAAGTDISGNPVTFTATTGTTAFNIEVRFLSAATP